MWEGAEKKMMHSTVKGIRVASNFKELQNGAISIKLLTKNLVRVIHLCDHIYLPLALSGQACR